jgi:thioredoxin-related protein
MRYLILFSAFILSSSSFSQEKVNWMTWDEAVKANEKEPKLIFIDLYTSWCGWCKVMDQKTFSNEGIAKQMNNTFYAVKFDAERKDTIHFKGQQLVNGGGGRSPHQLAVSLLEKNMSYPSFVVLNEKFERLNILKGYRDVKFMDEYFQFYADKKYLEPQQN